MAARKSGDLIEPVFPPVAERLFREAKLFERRLFANHIHAFTYVEIRHTLEKAGPAIEVMLVDLKKNRTIVMVSHDLDQVRGLADAAPALENGKFVAG